MQTPFTSSHDRQRRARVSLWALVLGALSSYASLTLPVAYADEMALMSESGALRMHEALNGVHEVRILCAACGEAGARLTHVDAAHSIHVAAPNDTLFALYLDGVRVDPRSVYVVRRARWVSLGTILDYPRGAWPQMLAAGGFDDRGQRPARLAPLPPVLHALERRCELLGTLPQLADAVVRCRTQAGADRYEDAECRVQESADFGGAPGPETVVLCDFADYNGAALVTDARSVRWLQDRESIIGVGVSVDEVVPNGDDVRELVLGIGTEDGSSIEIVALLAGGWQTVFRLDTSSGMMDTGQSANACIEGTSPTEGASIVVRRRSRGSRAERVEHMIWRAAAEAFVPATPAELRARAAPSGEPRCL